jgi:hypothetical protein
MANLTTGVAASVVGRLPEMAHLTATAAFGNCRCVTRFRRIGSDESFAMMPVRKRLRRCAGFVASQEGIGQSVLPGILIIHTQRADSANCATVDTTSLSSPLKPW